MPLIRRDDPDATPAEERRQASRDRDGLIAQLDDRRPVARRRASRELAGDQGAVDALCDALEREQDEGCRHAMLTALLVSGGQRVQERLLPLLRSEDAGLRNGAIEVLQGMPKLAAGYMDELLADSDSDVRIFAVNILESLRHERVPEWLRGVLERDGHVNVCAAAVDVLAEVGDDDCLAALRQLPGRFPGEPFIAFAVRTAERRITGEEGGDDR
ncbi:HEAT repeat domain-containing protein [Aquisalimonas asiatica]|uniref:HEAT repeat-containing protein n=1 Tax=Aquisalimonas asiatica TaxID=406100 RepID=A0A1H8QRC9_9GAMM|nr:HEAT repeat domain-containing protein [Aquisalimonas asiatica]SEO56596.1 HEAT repeat-containing protein [Aquisalimonas asiatica]